MGQVQYKKQQKISNVTNYKLIFNRCKNSVTQNWTRVLRPSEEVTLLYILDRTLRFDKPSEIILRNYIGNDIISHKTGEVVQSGITISPRTYSRCIKRLQELKLISCSIETNRRGRGSRVTVVPANILEKPMSHLKKSKKSNTGGVVTKGHTGSCHNDTIEARDNREAKDNQSSTSNLEEAVAHAERSSKERREKKKKEDTLQGYSTLWLDTHIDLFGKDTCIQVTGTDWGILKKRRAQVSTGYKIDKLLRWSMENWMQLSRTKMAWAVEKSLMGCSPNPTTFSMLFNKFLQHYNDEDVAGTRVYVDAPKNNNKPIPIDVRVKTSIDPKVKELKLTSSKKRKVEPTADWNTLGDVDLDFPEWDQ